MSKGVFPYYCLQLLYIERKDDFMKPKLIAQFELLHFYHEIVSKK